MTFASGGITDWQAWVGIEKIWNSEPRPGSMSRYVPSGSRMPARVVVMGAIPPMAGTLWQPAQLVLL